MSNVESGETKSTRIEHVPILGAKLVEISSQQRRLITITDQASIIAHSWTDGTWIQIASQLLPARTLHGRMTGLANIAYYPDIAADVVVATTARTAVFLDLHTLDVLSKIDATEDDLAFNEVMLGQTSKCSECGLLAFRSVAVVSGDSTSNECHITTIRPADEDERAVMCVRQGTASCRSFDNAQRNRKGVTKPGAWSAASPQVVLGLRKTMAQSMAKVAPKSLSHLRQRRHARFNTQPEACQDTWEAYSISLDGEMETVDASPDHEDTQHGSALYVTSPGPAVALDAQSVAVAFGNTVKVLASTRRGSMIGRRTGRKLERQALNLLNGVVKRE